MRFRLGLVTLSLLAAGCANGSSPSSLASLPNTAAPASGLDARNAIVPVVSAHQHLMSPLAVPPPIASLATIELPKDLAQLLHRREQVSGSPPSGDLFTEDAILQDLEKGRWERGRKQIDTFLGFMFKDIHYVPNAYAVDGSAGYIAGTVRLGADTKEEMNFLLGIKKNAQGKWQIASELSAIIPPPPYSAPITADMLIKELDDAGIKRGVLLSVGYWFGGKSRERTPDEYDKVRAENDWTAAEAARYPDRLVAFCGVNPLSDYALQEVQRCAKIPFVKGMKVHFANAGVEYDNPVHLEKLRQFFRAANANRMAIVVHMRTLGHYTPDDARIFLDKILPEAPDVPVQIAHLANSDEAAAVFADAIAAGDPRTKNLYFDIAQTVMPDSSSPERLATLAQLFRKIGLDRIFFGTDMILTSKDPQPRELWAAVRTLPLSDDELRSLADNVPPYMK